MTAIVDATPTTQPTGTPPDRPRWELPALGGLLLATSVFWVIGLSRNGWANAFYSAAVQAGTQNWTAFLFGSSDAGNSITVDKPPASLWPMEIAGRIFGVNSWSIQLPQVVLGVAAVALLYVIVKPHFGAAAGLIAGAVLALTPVATLMFRYNNPDALLVFLMVAAVWALLRGVHDGRTRWLVLCGALFGTGFLTKQLQVLLVVPGLALAYLAAGPRRLTVRWGQLAAGLAAMLVAAGWWVAIIELTPADQRPYVGGSTTDSFLELTFGYNGLGRLTGDENMPIGPPSGGFAAFGSHAGILRLLSGESGGQISWLLPAALALLVAGLVFRGRASRTDPQRAAYVVWGSWLLVTAAVFSFMSGIFHDYYTVALAPAVAALVGMGVTQLWGHRQKRWASWLLAAVCAATAVWAWVLLGRTPDFLPWLRWAVLAVGAVSAVMLTVSVARSSHIAPWVAGIACAAAIAAPLAYSVQTVSTAHAGPIVTAGPSLHNGGFPGMPNPASDGSVGDGTVSEGAATSRQGPTAIGRTEVSDQVAQLLSADASSYSWVAAVNGSNDAAQYQLATFQPVMAVGGFLTSDPSPTLEQFQRYVEAGRIHYYIEASIMGMPQMSDNAAGATPVFPGGTRDTEASRIAGWVEKHYTSQVVDGVTLYDLTQPTR